MGQEVAPEATLGMFYRMPGLAFRTAFLAVASQKYYVSMYLVHDQTILERFAAEVKPYDPGKGCVRFRDPEQIPWELVRRLVEAAVASARGQGAI